MFDEHIVFDHGNLRVAFAFAHHHQAVDMLAASQEVGTMDAYSAASVTTASLME